MPDTSHFDIPYPAGADGADGPAAFQDLAERLEAVMPIKCVKRNYVAAAQKKPTADGNYELLGTPDRCSGLVLPEDGFLLVSFQAIYKGGGQAGDGQAKAAIFLNDTQLTWINDDLTLGPEAAESAPLGSQGSGYVFTHPAGGRIVPSGGFSIEGRHGLRNAEGNTHSGSTLTMPTSGVANPIRIPVAAGTHKVEIQFKYSSIPADGTDDHAIIFSERTLDVLGVSMATLP